MDTVIAIAKGFFKVLFFAMKWTFILLGEMICVECENDKKAVKTLTLAEMSERFHKNEVTKIDYGDALN